MVFFNFFKHKFYRKNVGVSGIRSRRRVRWPLEHHHGASISFMFTYQRGISLTLTFILGIISLSFILSTSLSNKIQRISYFNKFSSVSFFYFSFLNPLSPFSLYLSVYSLPLFPWSSLDGRESVTGFPIRLKLGCFCKAFCWNFTFKNNPAYCWLGRLSGKASQWLLFI